MIRNIRSIMCLFVCVVLVNCAVPPDPAHAAFPHGGVSSTPPPLTNWVTDYYASSPNGFNHAGNVNIMPFGSFLVPPASGGGHVMAPYTNNATASVGLGAPIMAPAGAGFPSSFGTDDGSAAACKAAAGCYMIAAPGSGTDYNSNVTTSSVASMLSAYSSVSASANNTGYWIIDEPGQTTGCGNSSNPAPPELGGVPTAFSLTQGKDSSRWALVNSAQLPWYYVKPGQIPCGLSAYRAAFVASTIPSSDTYSCINGNNMQASETYAFPHVENTDGATHQTDCVFTQGIATAIGQDIMTQQGVQKPQGTYIAPMSNALTGNITAGQGFGFKMTAGSDIITISTNYVAIVPGLFFTNQLWVTPSGGSALGITQSAGTSCFTGTIHITSIITPTTAHTDVNTGTNGTCNWTGGGGGTDVFVTVAGGTENSAGWCNRSLNLCPTGVLIRDTVATALAQVFEHMDNGGLVVWFFGYDDCEGAPTFAFGDPSPGAGCPSGATTAAANFTSYTTGIFNGGTYNLANTYQLPTDGYCNMTPTDGSSDLTSCTNGGYTMATSVSTCPGVMIVKHDATYTYVHAMSNRASWSASNCGASAGSTMTFSGFSALNGHTVTVFYDTNSKVDVPHNHEGNTTTVSGGSFSFVMGANGNSYEHITFRISLFGMVFPTWRRRRKPANDDAAAAAA